LHAKLPKRELPLGSPKARLLPNGNRPVQFCGYTENVCISHHYSFTLRLTASISSRCGEEHPLVRSSLISSVAETHVIGSSTIIEDIHCMRKSGLASLAFFYCDFRHERKKERRDLLSSLLVQLCDQSDSYYGVLSNFYSTHGRGSRHPGEDELTRCLKNMINCSEQAPIYIIVDAIDESPNSYGTPSPRENVLILLEDLAGLDDPKLRICVTSRPEKDIEDVLRPLVSHSTSLHNEEGQNKDILDYITSVVNTDRKMCKWREKDKRLVIETLWEKADGM
jgi:hypothetical protein